MTTSRDDGVTIGTTFSDMFGEYEVVGEPVWSDAMNGYAQDVRTPEGYITRNAVSAIRQYALKEKDQ